MNQPALTRKGDAAPLAAAGGSSVHTARYALPDHIYLCSFACGSVLLDLKHNRYLGIDRDATNELTGLVRTTDAAEPASESAAERWLRRGLIEPKYTSDEQPFTPHLPAPDSALEDLQRTPSRLGVRDLAIFSWVCASTRRALRSRSLWQIASGLRKRRERRPATHTSEERLMHAVARFRRLRPYAFTSRDQCLFHALALTRVLEAQRLPGTWVIGVRLRPWGAHSWVQHGTRILDATPEAVHDFRPIMAV